MCKECGCGQGAARCPQCGGSIVLIDGDPVCATCEATFHTHDNASHTHSHDDHTQHQVPHTHDHTDHTHTHDHADHTHDHAAHAHAQEILINAEDVARLRVLVPHWIEHNKDHAAGFRDWATRARKAHLESVASRIDAAAIQMEACNQILSTALEELKGR